MGESGRPMGAEVNGPKILNWAVQRLESKWSIEREMNGPDRSLLDLLRSPL